MNRWIVGLVIMAVVYISGIMAVSYVDEEADQSYLLGYATGVALFLILIYSIISYIIKKIYKVCKRQGAEGESPPLSPP